MITGSARKTRGYMVHGWGAVWQQPEIINGWIRTGFARVCDPSSVPVACALRPFRSTAGAMSPPSFSEPSVIIGGDEKMCCMRHCSRFDVLSCDRRQQAGANDLFFIQITSRRAVLTQCSPVSNYSPYLHSQNTPHLLVLPAPDLHTHVHSSAVSSAQPRFYPLCDAMRRTLTRGQMRGSSSVPRHSRLVQTVHTRQPHAPHAQQGTALSARAIPLQGRGQASFSMTCTCQHGIKHAWTRRACDDLAIAHACGRILSQTFTAVDLL